MFSRRVRMFSRRVRVFSRRVRIGHVLPSGGVWSAGQTIGNYKLVAELRAGGMATLFLAQKRGVAGFSRPVAIKFVHPELAADDHFRQMFLDEALLASRIHHPNVAQVEELGEFGGSHYLVMEYVHGCSLAQLMKVLYLRQRRLTPAFAVRIAMHVAEGLHAAHETRDEQGRPLAVVHRDVSPENILLAYAGHVKLIDFGIAKSFGRKHRTQEGVLKGKFRYMTPEQALARPVDRRTDVYQLGIVLWEMLTLRRMFDAENDVALIQQVRAPQILKPSLLVNGITQALDDAVLAALDADPSARPADAQAFARMLAKAVPEALSVDSGSLRALLEAAMQDERRRDQRTFPPEVFAALEEQVQTLPLGGTGVVPRLSNLTLEHGTPLAAPGAATEPQWVPPAIDTLEVVPVPAKPSVAWAEPAGTPDPEDVMSRARRTQEGFASPGRGVSERVRPVVGTVAGAPRLRKRRLVRLASELRTTITRITEVEWVGSPGLWLSLGVSAGLLTAVVFVIAMRLHGAPPPPPQLATNTMLVPALPTPPPRLAPAVEASSDAAVPVPAEPSFVAAEPTSVPAPLHEPRGKKPRARAQVIVDGTPLLADPGY